MAKRVNLVTGALGFSGAYLLRELLAQGQTVIGTDLASNIDSPSQREICAQIGLDLEHPKLTLVPANLLEPDSLKALSESPPTHVFHTASLYDYSASLERLRQVNVVGTQNLVESLDSSRLERFVHWSTCGVFGKPYTAASGDKVNIPFAEDSPSPKNTEYGLPGPAGTKLVNVYSVTKWEQEQMLWKRHREEGLPLTVIRPAPIYGPGSNYGHGGIILAIAQGFVPAIPKDARHYITSSVHVQDIARFAAFAVTRDETLGEDYNVVDNSIISYAEFLQYIALLTGRNLREVPFITLERARPVMERAAHLWTWLEQSLGIPRVKVFEVQSAPYVSSSYWLSNRKSLKTGFEYSYPDVHEGLKDTIAWFRRMGWLSDRSQLMQVSSQGSKPTG